MMTMTTIRARCYDDDGDYDANDNNGNDDDDDDIDDVDNETTATTLSLIVAFKTEIHFFVSSSFSTPTDLSSDSIRLRRNFKSVEN